MNSRNIKKHMNAKVKDWIASIDDDSVKTAIRQNLIITGGALVSLLTGEQPHDYDCYFKTKEACMTVANYYINKWNTTHPDDKQATLKVNEETGRVQVFIQSAGVAGETKEETEETGRMLPSNNESITDEPFPPIEKSDEEKALEADAADKTEKPKYRPVFLSSNAITLSDKIQIVTRFYGDVDEIHKNYDFAHCTCSWSMWDNEVNLPNKALECIINKELYYIGSKYPLCSIIRTRKYIERGYHINAGQFIKMAWQLNGLDLTDVEVLEDQITGVDTTYAAMLIEALKEHQKNQPESEQKINGNYLFELINRMF